MKLLTHLKTLVLLAYVALCTHMVLTVLEGEPAPAGIPLPEVLGE